MSSLAEDVVDLYLRKFSPMNAGMSSKNDTFVRLVKYANVAERFAREDGLNDSDTAVKILRRIHELAGFPNATLDDETFLRVMGLDNELLFKDPLKEYVELVLKEHVKS